jgi:hypothetical protein
MSSAPAKGGKAAADHEILKQSWFKSVGPRTYAAQVKKAGNGNHFLVLTEGKRDEATGEVRKTRLFLFSEDFAAFFKMMQETAVFIRENPVPEKIKRQQERKWAKINGKAASGPRNAPPPGNAAARPAVSQTRPGTANPGTVRRPDDAAFRAGPPSSPAAAGHVSHASR